MKKNKNISVGDIVKKAIPKCLPVLIAGLLFNTSVSKAQVAFSIGPKAGLSINSFSGDSAGNVSANTAWAGGLFMNLHLLDFLAIQPELLIHQKGATQTINNVSNEIKINYFEVPILLKIMIPVEKHIYPHVFVGPSFSYNMNGTFASKNTETGTELVFNEGDIKKSDTGGILGAGIDFETNHLYINLDGRYGVGFNDIGKNSIKLRNTNWTFMLGIGYRFGTSKDKVVVK